MLGYCFNNENKTTTRICRFSRTVHDIVMKSIGDVDRKYSSRCHLYFEPIKEASLKHLTFKTVFLLALGSGKSRSEIHAWQNRNIRHQSDWSRCPCTHHPAFSPRISWPKRVQKVWPQGYNSPGPQLWIDPSSLTGPSVQSEHCATIWTGPRAE